MTRRPAEAFALHRIEARRVPGRRAKASAERLAIALVLAAGAVALFAAPPVTVAPAAPAASCESLTHLSLSDTTITSAETVPAGLFKTPGGRGSEAPTVRGTTDLIVPK